jgi:hypothetical protein
MREKGYPGLGGISDHSHPGGPSGVPRGSGGSREERTCSGFRGILLTGISLPALSVKPKTQVQGGECVPRLSFISTGDKDSSDGEW